MMKAYTYLIVLFCLTGCTHKQNPISSVSQETDTLRAEVDVNFRPQNREIPIYEEIGKYQDHLSDIASEISFVKLSNEPLIRDFSSMIFNVPINMLWSGD